MRTDGFRRMLIGIAAVVLPGTATLIGLASPASAAPAAAAAQRAGAVVCGSASHPALAARLARDISAARRGRVSTVAVRVDDPGAGVNCWLNSSMHFDSASVVKATILAALLRKAQDSRRHLTRTEAALAWAMITRSDNAAASALWNDVGRSHLQHFLNLAGMTHTFLGPGGFWGLTLITASDETLLLRLLLNGNSVLGTASRNYELALMASVIPSQRWGVTAGAPTRLVAHIKNGWLPLPTHQWHVHSIGAFSGRGGGYSIVVLTQDDPTMTYGIITIEKIARAIHRDLNPGATSVVPSVIPATSGTPDEPIPPLGG